MKKNILYVAWAIALVATLGSLYLSEVLHWAPCALCWYQRIFIYPLALILPAAILKEIKDIEFIVLPLALTGMLVSIYHNLLLYKIIPDSLAPCSGGVSCTIPYHFFHPLITIPLLSFLTLLSITICMIVYRKANS